MRTMNTGTRNTFPAERRIDAIADGTMAQAARGGFQANTRIPYEKRIKRASRGLMSDPNKAIPLIERFASMPLIDFFGGDQRRTSTIIAPLRGEGITPVSTLADAMTVIARHWEGGGDSRRNIYPIALGFALHLSGVANEIKDDEPPRKTKAAPKAMKAGCRKVPYTKRVGNPSRTQLPAVDAVLWLKTGDYLDAIAAATGDSRVTASRTAIEELEPKLISRCIGVLALAFRKCQDDPCIETILETLLIHPLSALGNHGKRNLQDTANGSAGTTGRCVGAAQDCLDDPDWTAKLIDEFPFDWLLHNALAARAHARDDIPGESDLLQLSELETGEMLAYGRRAMLDFAELPMDFLLQNRPDSLDKLEECAANRMIDLSTFGACTRAIERLLASQNQVEEHKANELIALTAGSMGDFNQEIRAGETNPQSVADLEFNVEGMMMLDDALEDVLTVSPAGCEAHVRSFHAFTRLPSWVLLEICKALDSEGDARWDHRSTLTSREDVVGDTYAYIADQEDEEARLLQFHRTFIAPFARLTALAADK